MSPPRRAPASSASSRRRAFPSRSAARGNPALPRPVRRRPVRRQRLDAAEARSGEKTRDVFELIVDEGVKFVETSGRNPEEFMPLLKQAGVKVLHKVPAVRFAVKAASVGVDAVAIVGAECGGHPGLDMVGSFVNAAWAESQLDIPYLIGGGIGRGSQLAAALAMGASGVVVGTRFAVAEEIWAHDDYKRRLVEAGPTDTDLCMQSVRNTVRTLRNETTEAVKALEARNPDVTIQDLMPMVAGKIGRNAYVTGDWSKGLLSAGHRWRSSIGSNRLPTS